MVVDHTGEQSIPILMYHSISGHASPGFRSCVVSPETFEKHLIYLDQCHYTSVTITQFMQAIARGGDELPPRLVILTFDDGYADFYTSAFPALQRHGFTATLYVATEFVGSTSCWLQHMGEGMRPMLTWEQLAEISAGSIECGAHTHTHQALDMLPLSEARDEIVRSKELLEDHLGIQVSSFAYPFGYYNARVRQTVQAIGFSSACAIKGVLSSLHDDPYALARLAIKPDTDACALDAALSTGRGPLVASKMKQVRAHLQRYARSAYGKLWLERHLSGKDTRLR